MEGGSIKDNIASLRGEVAALHSDLIRLADEMRQHHRQMRDLFDMLGLTLPQEGKR